MKIVFFVFLIFSDAATGYAVTKIPIYNNTSCDEAVEKLTDNSESDFGYYVNGKLLNGFYCKDINNNWYR